MDWWDTVLKTPSETIAPMLDAICQMEVDFVFFGGDMLDYFDPRSAEHLVELCRERNLKAYFMLGNHDEESLEQRFGSQRVDVPARKTNGKTLCQIWGMPNYSYSFSSGAVRFLVLDMLYQRALDGNFAAHVSGDDVRWFLKQIQSGDPTVVFTHFPFNCPTLEHRLRAVWDGKLKCAAEDEHGAQLLHAIETSPNVIALFAGHSHFSSEDPLGNCWQFMTASAYQNFWRHVRIHNTEPPMSIRCHGKPDVY